MRKCDSDNESSSSKEDEDGELVDESSLEI
jgi:hypothetical protein